MPSNLRRRASEFRFDFFLGCLLFVYYTIYYAPPEMKYDSDAFIAKLAIQEIYQIVQAKAFEHGDGNIGKDSHRTYTLHHVCENNPDKPTVRRPSRL